MLVGHSIGGLIVLELSQRLGAAAAAGGPPELAALGLPRQVRWPGGEKIGLSWFWGVANVVASLPASASVAEQLSN